MNVFITGATGFIGSHLCKELVRRGHYVVALSRSGRTNNIKANLSLEKVIEKYEGLYSDCVKTSRLSLGGCFCLKCVAKNRWKEKQNEHSCNRCHRIYWKLCD